MFTIARVIRNIYMCINGMRTAKCNFHIRKGLRAVSPPSADAGRSVNLYCNLYYYYYPLLLWARAERAYTLLYELMTCGTRERDLVIEWEELGEREREIRLRAEWLKQDKLEWCARWTATYRRPHRLAVHEVVAGGYWPVNADRMELMLNPFAHVPLNTCIYIYIQNTHTHTLATHYTGT